MRKHYILKSLVVLFFFYFQLIILTNLQNPYKAPLLNLKYHITRKWQEFRIIILEQALSDNINWLEQNLKSYGYNMVCMGRWGDTSQINENGYRKSHSSHRQHDYAWWSNSQSKGMTFECMKTLFGFSHVDPNDTNKKIVELILMYPLILMKIHYGSNRCRWIDQS